MRVEWDKSSERKYETGINQVVLYVWNATKYGSGVAWNGITGITESPSGAENTDLYADNIKYLSMISAETLGATIEGYMYPDEFAECDGSVSPVTGMNIGQQARKSFALCYKTIVGNDTEGEAYGYKLHLLYGCKASPSERPYQTINDSPEANSMSWEVNTTPVNVAGYKPTALVTIDSTAVNNPAKMAEIEAYLYGVDEFSATKTYAVGEYVVEDEKVYKCTTAVTVAGAFDESDWTEQTGMTGEPTLILPDDVIRILGAAQG